MQFKSLLEKGITEKITFAKESLDRSVGQYDRIQVENAEESEFFKQFSKNNLVRDKALEVIQNQIIPTFKKLQDFVHGEYSKHLRKSAGLVSLNNLKGDEFYQACLDFHATLKGVDARELHNFGLKSLRTSQARFVKLAKILGLSGNESPTFVEAAQWYDNNPNMFFNSSEAIVAAFVGETENIKPRLKFMFEEKLLSNSVMSINVKAVPPTGGGIAYYKPSTVDGRREGNYIYIYMYRIYVQDDPHDLSNTTCLRTCPRTCHCRN
jgi:uncharacterized protein (DUF885 family)